jgi:hypothetical protein
MQRRGKMRRSGVTATERKFGEAIEPTWLDPSVLQPKSEWANFLFESTVTR